MSLSRAFGYCGAGADGLAGGGGGFSLFRERRRPELVGGGLIRSLGFWSAVLSLRRRGILVAADQRILRK